MSVIRFVLCRPQHPGNIGSAARLNNTIFWSRSTVMIASIALSMMLSSLSWLTRNFSSDARRLAAAPAAAVSA